MKWHGFALLFFAFMAAYGQDGAYRIGNGVSAPDIISRRDPQYPEDARKARLEGTVTLSLVIGENGEAKNIRAVRSMGYGLDEKAIEAVSTWRFAPGQKDGNPVPVMATIDVNFRLLESAGRWYLTMATFKPSEGASLPSLLKPEFPPDGPAQEPGSVTLTFDVDEQGNPINIHVEKSSDAGSERDVIAAARKWRFNPGMKDGRPIVVPLTLQFSQGRKDRTSTFGVGPKKAQ